MADDLLMERIAFRKPPFQVLGRAHQEIHRERSLNCHADLDGLIMLIPHRHDNQDVHVTVFMRPAVSMGAEVNNLVRPGDGAGHQVGGEGFGR